MLLPYSTDAPLYHWPIATVGLIVANVLVFCATVLQVFLGSFEPEQVEWLMILFNQINPVQWITGSFIHADPVHLAGNMMFLWAFGLVVEGKCGWWKFLLIYFAILIACAATIQSAMFLLIDRDGGTMGASGAIFGIMMIAMIWAPENEMDCIVVFFRFARTIEIRLAALAGFFIAMQVFLFVYSGMSLSAEVMQLFGVVYAMPIGFWMLRQDIVDCEGWDLVARTDFLLASPVFCTDKQRARQVHREEVKEDAVAVALGSKTTSHHGMVVSSYHQKQADKAAAAKSKKAKSTKGPPKATTAMTTAPRQPPSAHPEFNRQTFLLRQAITQGSAVAAAGPWSRLCQFQLIGGVAPQTLWNYVQLLQSQQSYAEMLSPLQALARDSSTSSNRARLKIAQLQANLNRDRPAAIATLQSIVSPDQPTGEDQTVIAQRDQLLVKWGGEVPSGPAGAG